MNVPLSRMTKWIGATLAVLLLLIGVNTVRADVHADIHADVYEKDHTAHVETLLRHRIEAISDPASLEVDGRLLYAKEAVVDFYRTRVYELAWLDENGLRPAALEYIDVLRRAHEEGLRASDYYLDWIEAQAALINSRDRPQHVREWVDLELRLTDSFLTYGAHLHNGRIHPETRTTEWSRVPETLQLVEMLEQALRAGAVRALLDSLLPQHPQYERLKEALRVYREVAAAGGWPRLPDGPTLRLGNRDPRIAVLRARLAPSFGEDLLGAGDPNLFDERLDEAVREFQIRHGLVVDGIVGPRTRAELNVPVSQWIRRIEVNLERWRWLPNRFESRYIMVDIANFRLDAIEDGEVAFTTRAVVGTPYRQTPVFGGRMTYLVLNPFWHVPNTIAVEDILPRVRADVNYLAQNGFTVLQGWGAQTREVDPTTVNWARVPVRGFPYRFRQNAGPTNALGRIKFMFPNAYDVYIHDTPQRDLFQQTVRNFSSGCIRIEDPVEFAEYVLRGAAGWDRAGIDAALATGVERTVRLPQSLPVYLLYWTAWVGPDERIYFRPDIYQRDPVLERALQG